MRWENLQPQFAKRVAHIPGGTAIVDFLVEALDIKPSQKVLALCPSDGIVPAMIAKEYSANVTLLTDDLELERSSENQAKALGTGGLVTVVPGHPAAIPTPAENFDRAFCIAHPFPLSTAAGIVTEIHRVLASDAILGLAGPAALNNLVPPYMKKPLSNYNDMILKTPAYTALRYSKEGFNIIRAEFMQNAYDLWVEWMKEASEDVLPEVFRKAIKEDGGRWLSFGIIVLHKPLKPEWAV